MRTKAIRQNLTLLLLLWCWCGCGQAAAREVTLPLTIDYPFLQNLIVSKAFRGSNESAVLLDEGNGCLYLALSHPRVREEQGYLRLETEVTVHAGTPLGGQCLVPVRWRGFLVLYQRPRINSRTWQLSFKGHHSRLLDRDHRPVRVAEPVWRLIETQVFEYLEAITIDLSPPVNNLKGFLLPLFPQRVRRETQVMLESLRADETTLTPEAVIVHCTADVQEVYRPDEGRFREPLDGRELEEVVAVWEQWDALLSSLLVVMSRDILSVEERRTLVNVLLETRYGFVENLRNNDLRHDFVREQFAAAWQQLSPVFRNHFSHEVSERNIGYFSFLTAADALTVLDALGPTFGIEVSREGLLRLAGMLSEDPALLQYNSGVNRELQRLFELDATPLPAPDMVDPPAMEPFEEEGRPPPSAPASPTSSPLSLLLDFLCAPLQAAEPLSRQAALQWQVPSTGVDTYVRRVVALLESQAGTTGRDKKIDPALRATFTRMILALAWQESCFRQFVARNGQMNCLVSHNNSSVGLMQVNRRVWRGLYDLDRLCWDIRYNAAAGCEIAAMYLREHALRGRGDGQLHDQESVARLVFAMYNGGPVQYKKYLERERTGRFNEIDRVYWEKYEWVAAANWEMMARCLGGGDAGVMEPPGLEDKNPAAPGGAAGGCRNEEAGADSVQRPQQVEEELQQEPVLPQVEMPNRA